VIPFAEAEELVANSRLSQETRIEVGNDYRLADDEFLSVILWTCSESLVEPIRQTVVSDR
jgi:hypothetical protein